MRLPSSPQTKKQTMPRAECKLMVQVTRKGKGIRRVMLTLSQLPKETWPWYLEKGSTSLESTKESKLAVLGLAKLKMAAVSTPRKTNLTSRLLTGRTQLLRKQKHSQKKLKDWPLEVLSSTSLAMVKSGWTRSYIKPKTTTKVSPSSKCRPPWTLTRSRP